MAASVTRPLPQPRRPPRVLHRMTAHRRLCAAGILFLLAVRIAAPAADEPPIDAKCQKLLTTWKDRLDEDRFAYVVPPPFVIAGNGGMDRLKDYRDHTILAATRCLQN